MDFAFAACQTNYMFCTHSDCFLRRQDYLESLIEMCNADCPVVGYQMSERWNPLWKGCVSHTATLLYMPTMYELGISWNMRRGERVFKGKCGGSRRIGKPGWPDTETYINLLFRQHGIKPLLLGEEFNGTRQVNQDIDHCRSFSWTKLYNSHNRHLPPKKWMRTGMREARRRILRWTQPEQFLRRTQPEQWPKMLL